MQTLTVNVVDGFMPFVTNQAGRTIYRFDNDSANPSRTTCTGECAKKWEPVLAGQERRQDPEQQDQPATGSVRSTARKASRSR